MKAISESRYAEAAENYEGWCTKCEDFTHESAEPDAHGYKCPECGELTVIGAEDALLGDCFTFTEDEAAS